MKYLKKYIFLKESWKDDKKSIKNWMQDNGLHVVNFDLLGRYPEDIYIKIGYYFRIKKLFNYDKLELEYVTIEVDGDKRKESINKFSGWGPYTDRSIFDNNSVTSSVLDTLYLMTEDEIEEQRIYNEADKFNI